MHRATKSIALFLSISAALGSLMLGGCRTNQYQTAHLELGESQYRQHCASCHGLLGEGDGPVAPELDQTLRSLRLLSLRYDGVFPTEYVLRTIDGCKEFQAHGTRTMPIWGNIWRPGEEESLEAEIATQRSLNGLLDYLRSLQLEE
jgi:mono/diheme cytochrome c family protein